MTNPNAGECALWYWRDGRLDVDLFDSEQEAAEHAALLVDDTMGCSPIGVQFPDGRTVAVDVWAAYPAARERRRTNEERWQRERAENPPVMVEITDPFFGKSLRIHASDPEWLGRR